MFGIQVILAALAFVGAPTNTSVSCNPYLPVAGRTTFANPAYIQLGGYVNGPCAGIILASVDPKTRDQIDKLNGITDPNSLIAFGLLVTLHESIHVATGDRDETNVECKAMAAFPGFVKQFFTDPIMLVILSQDAKRDDALLSPAYHTHPC